MKNRWITIINELLKHKKVVSGNQLAIKLNISVRTLRSDIQSINEIILHHGASIIAIQSKGYILDVKDSDRFSDYLKEMQINPSLDDDIYREYEIVRRLFFSKVNVKIDDICENLYLSRTTVQKILQHIRELLQPYNLSITFKPNQGMKIAGDEQHKRNFISFYFFQSNLFFTQRLFANNKEELQEIQETILVYMKEYDFHFTDNFISNLAIHIYIIKLTMTTEQPDEMKSVRHNIEDKEYSFIIVLLEKLEIVINTAGLDLLVFYVMQENKVIKDPARKENMYDSLIVSILESINTTMFIDFTKDQHLIEALMLHMIPTFKRIDYGLRGSNPLLNEIKKKYQLSFDIALNFSDKLLEFKSIKLSEDEIGWLALHFELAIERKKAHKKTPKILIVCASGLCSAQLLQQKLMLKFGNNIEIVGTTYAYDLSDFNEDYDLVVSTVELGNNCRKPWVIVNTILGNEDYRAIEKHIYHQTDQLFSFMRDTCIFLKYSFKTQEELLLFLGNNLLEQELVEQDFIDSVMERERLNATNFGNFVAVPHSMKPKAKENLISFMTLTEPIMWGKEKVSLICLIAASKNHMHELPHIYELLLSVIDSADTVKKLLFCNTLAEFKSVIINN